MVQLLNFLKINNYHNRLIDVLVKRGLLNKLVVNDLKKALKNEEESLTELIFANTLIENEDKVLATLSEFFKLPTVLLRHKSIAPQVLNLIPKEVAEQHQVITFKKIKNVVLVATANPENLTLSDFITKKTGLAVNLFITTPKDIALALRKYNLKGAGDLWHLTNDSKENKTDELNAEKLERLAESIPIIKMINGLIEQAFKSNASDIHFEPIGEKVIVRFRVDGILHKINEYPKSLLPLITARIKVLANLKIDEHILPQDGRFQYLFDNDEIAIRVSIIPTLNGAKSALRLLEMKDKAFTLKKLGVNKNHYSLLKEGIKYPYGMILVTGPTGSGKTTTLYTLLKMLNKEAINICTIEDPIEYGIPNINQMQVRPEVGLTFAKGLRALLRQDPNVLMVGEIRDLETAEIAANAAMTGHLVLSTLHTNNAFLAPQRLIEMGVQSFLVSSVINLIIGQRLVRKLCRHCRIPVRSHKKFFAEYKSLIPLPATFKKLKQQKLLPREANINQVTFYRSRGCAKCNYTGYQGRVGIYEIIKLDDHVRELILKHQSGEELRKILIKKIPTMLEDGILKIFNGVTTIEEVLRASKE